MQTLEHYFFNGLLFACIIGLVIQTGEVYKLEDEVKVLSAPTEKQKVLLNDPKIRAIMCAK